MLLAASCSSGPGRTAAKDIAVELVDGTYFPLSLETEPELRRFTWTGTMLAEQAAPAPDP